MTFGSDTAWFAGALAFMTVQSLLIVILFVERRRQRRIQHDIDQRLKFEVLVAELTAGFVEIPRHEIDGRIKGALARIVRELEIDRVGLAEFGPDGQLQVTYLVSSDEAVEEPLVFTPEVWPWTLGRLRAGHTVCITRLTDLPAEALVDQESFAQLGTKSAVIQPLVVGGTVVGTFGCGMMRSERDWPEEFVHRLRLLADVIAVALMRRRADRALEESEDRFHQMTDTAPVMMWMAGPDGRCTSVNRAWLDFTGRTLADQIGDGWLDGVHPDDRQTCRDAYQAAVIAQASFTIEYRLRRVDGVYRPVLDSGVPSFDARHRFRGYVGSTVDVTDVKAAQQTLVESLALRSAIFGSLYGQMAAVDRRGVIIAVNESWTRFMTEMGADPGTAGVGANYLDVCRAAAAHGDPHAPAALEALEGVLSGRNARALLEYPSSTSSGVQWYAMIVEPFKRPEGGLVISHIDVTRRRRAEEEAQREREELAHALRVATLGELATSLAHEINQPLAAIASNAQAARRLLEGAIVDLEVPAVLRDISDDAQRAAQVIRRLRVLFKKEQGERLPVDLTQIIEEVLSLLHKHLERRRLRMEVALEAEAPKVLGDFVQLQQVILNVLVNAAEAMTDEVTPRELHVETQAREAGIVTIIVRDSGPGVEVSELEHIFERFVTTKPGGLGMGLSISRSIIKAHGGRMWATRNAAGRGLTMHIELPCIESS